MSPETVEQYKLEERALMAKRLRLAKYGQGDAGNDA